MPLSVIAIVSSCLLSVLIPPHPLLWSPDAKGYAKSPKADRKYRLFLVTAAPPGPDVEIGDVAVAVVWDDEQPSEKLLEGRNEARSNELMSSAYPNLHFWFPGLWDALYNIEITRWNWW